MDPNEILRHGGDLAKLGTAAGAAVPFTAIVKRILGPAADEIAERVRDEIRVYRFGRQLSLLQKAESMAREAGFTPNAVPIKLLFALLEGASLEENEDLHDKWATLLTNAASPRMAAWVRPSFTETLRLMPSEAARFLDAVYASANEKPAVLPASDLGIDFDEEPHVQSISSNQKLRALTRIDLGDYEDLFALFAQVGGTTLPAATFVTSDSPEEQIEQDEMDRQSFAVLMDELTRFQMWSIRTQGFGGSFQLVTLCCSVFDGVSSTQLGHSQTTPFRSALQ